MACSALSFIAEHYIIALSFFTVTFFMIVIAVVACVSEYADRKYGRG